MGSEGDIGLAAGACMGLAPGGCIGVGPGILAPLPARRRLRLVAATGQLRRDRGLSRPCEEFDAAGVGRFRGARRLDVYDGDALEIEFRLCLDDVTGLGSGVQQGAVQTASRVEGARSPPGPTTVWPRAR